MIEIKESADIKIIKLDADIKIAEIELKKLLRNNGSNFAEIEKQIAFITDNQKNIKINRKEISWEFYVISELQDLSLLS